MGVVGKCWDLLPLAQAVLHLQYFSRHHMKAPREHDSRLHFLHLYINIKFLRSDDTTKPLSSRWGKWRSCIIQIEVPKVLYTNTGHKVLAKHVSTSNNIFEMFWNPPTVFPDEQPPRGINTEIVCCISFVSKHIYYSVFVKDLASLPLLPYNCTWVFVSTFSLPKISSLSKFAWNINKRRWGFSGSSCYDFMYSKILFCRTAVSANMI